MTKIRNSLFAILFSFLVATSLPNCAGEQKPSAEQQTVNTPQAQKIQKTATVRNLSVEQVRDLLEKERNLELIDVRTQPEWHGPLGRINGSVLKPVQEINNWVSELPQDKDKTIVLVCRSGNRSGRAGQVLVKAGYTSVINMSGGMLAWNAAKYPVDKSPDQN